MLQNASTAIPTHQVDDEEQVFASTSANMFLVNVHDISPLPKKVYRPGTKRKTSKAAISTASPHKKEIMALTTETGFTSTKKVVSGNKNIRKRKSKIASKKQISISS